MYQSETAVPKPPMKIDIPALRFQIDQGRAVICLSAALVT